METNEYVYYNGRRYPIFVEDFRELNHYWRAFVNLEDGWYTSNSWEYQDSAYGRSREHAIRCLQDIFYQTRIDIAIRQESNRPICDVDEYTIEVEELEGRYLAEILEIPGCIAEGNSEEKAIKNVIDFANRIKNKGWKKVIRSRKIFKRKA